MGCYALLQGNLPDSGIEPVSPVAPALQADSLPLSHRGSLYLFTTMECKLHWKQVLKIKGLRISILLKKNYSPVVRTQHFHCQGLGSILGWGTRILQAVWPGRENSAKTEEDQTLSVLLSSRKTVIRSLFLLT